MDPTETNLGQVASKHGITVAYDSGYFDQSHFIRDFKSFTGVTPSAYRKNITPVNQLLLQ